MFVVFLIFFLSDKLVKSLFEAPGWLWKKFDIQGVVFLMETRLYIWYVGFSLKTCNAVDRTFYDAILSDKLVKRPFKPLVG